MDTLLVWIVATAALVIGFAFGARDCFRRRLPSGWSFVDLPDGKITIRGPNGKAWRTKKWRWTFFARGQAWRASRTGLFDA